MRHTETVKNDPQTIFGWCMYDWANSAYATTVLVGLLPYYFIHSVVGPDGLTIGGTTYTGFSLWGYATGLAAFLTFLTAPVLGAISDFSAAKKRFLLFFSSVGSLFTLFLYFSRSGDILRTLVIFLIAQMGYIAANIFYDAFLPEIASEDKMDWISGKGYSYGYVGGGIQFALALALVARHETLGLSQEQTVRIAILTAGLWWGGFTLLTAKYLREAPASTALRDAYRGWPRPLAYAAAGLARTIRTTLRVGRFRHLALFLVAYLLYNEGIQTVIEMATAYGTEELHLEAWQLMLTLLVIQAVAFAGALLFGWMAGRIGSKCAVMVSLVGWSGVVIFAYFIQTAGEYFFLGTVVGLVLGGSQALSRSLYGSMIPEGASAEFFGFYTVFSKFSSFWGPFTLATIRQLTGSARLSIASLIVFFVLGLLLLYLVDEEKAKEAKQAGAF